ncbi:DUF2164 domain-containing protein [Gottschalkiaceae bacterium SANA]|nr:DUF2164 domain-containing protein [Gottschalkiaceae bacterium SANA]
MNKEWKLTKEQRKSAIEAVQAYFSNERQEDIGDLAALLLIDQILPILAGSFYNQGVNDSVERAQNHIEELYALEIPLP